MAAEAGLSVAAAGVASAVVVVAPVVEAAVEEVVAVPSGVEVLAAAAVVAQVATEVESA